MKRYITILLALLLLCGCAKKSPADTQPVETTLETMMPAATEPELEYMTAEVDGIPAVLATLSRGDTVHVVGAFDEKHHIVKLDTGYGMVEKNLIRLEGETPFEAWSGYSYHNAEVYDNYRLAGDPVKKLASNAKVEVLDDLGYCLLVHHDGVDGYMKPEQLAKSPRGGGSGSGSSKNNGGGAGNEGGSDGNATGEDGGDIWLQASWEVTRLSVITSQQGEAAGKATVLADGTEVVLGYFDRGDRIPVVKQNSHGDQLTVCLDGLYASVSGVYIRAEDAPDYKTWKGGSKYLAEIYGDFWMTGSPIDRLNANTEVTVLYELEHCYLVEANGVTGYIMKDMVMEQEEEPVSKVPQQPAQSNPDSGNAGSTQPESGNTSSGSGGTGDTKPESGSKPVPDSGSGGNTTPESGNTPAPEDKPSDDGSGGNTGSNSGNSDPEWTPPVL